MQYEGSLLGSQEPITTNQINQSTPTHLIYLFQIHFKIITHLWLRPACGLVLSGFKATCLYAFPVASMHATN
jgi:hypothetical protein